jgi:hypothetical protein
MAQHYIFGVDFCITLTLLMYGEKIKSISGHIRNYQQFFSEPSGGLFYYAIFIPQFCAINPNCCQTGDIEQRGCSRKMKLCK